MIAYKSLEAAPRRESPAAARGRSFPRFPGDLRVWLKGSSLLHLAQAIAQEQAVGALDPVSSCSPARFEHPPRLLVLVTCAYSSGMWSSQAVAELVALDRDVGAFFHGEAPRPETIRRFRNHNRLAVLRCLEQLVRRLWCHRFNQKITATHPLLSVEILCDARQRLQRAEQSDAAPAEGLNTDSKEEM